MLITKLLDAVQTACPLRVAIRESSVLKANLGLVASVVHPHYTSVIGDWCNAIEKDHFDCNLQKRLHLRDTDNQLVEEPPTEDELAAAEPLCAERMKKTEWSDIILMSTTRDEILASAINQVQLS